MHFIDYFMLEIQADLRHRIYINILWEKTFRVAVRCHIVIIRRVPRLSALHSIIFKAHATLHATIETLHKHIQYSKCVFHLIKVSFSYVFHNKYFSFFFSIFSRFVSSSLVYQLQCVLMASNKCDKVPDNEWKTLRHIYNLSLNNLGKFWMILTDINSHRYLLSPVI